MISRRLKATKLPKLNQSTAKLSHSVSDEVKHMAANIVAGKSWVPTEQPDLQKVTTKAVTYEISLQQMETTSRVVPWFLSNMPESYFRQVNENTRTQHIKAVAAIRELKQSDLSLKIDTKNEDGSMETTFIFSDSTPGALNRQISQLEIPAGTKLSNVKVFSATDGTMALNIFTFEPVAADFVAATKEDAKAIFQYAQELKDGKHAGDARAPQFSELFTEESLNEYIKSVNQQYASSSAPRKFLIERQLFEQVKSTESAVVHIEHSNDSDASWITVAAANVLPEVLLKLSSSMISARKLEVVRAQLDTVQDPANEMGPDMPGYVTMLRVMVNDNGKKLDHDSQMVKDLLVDIRRAKWLDDSVTHLGLIKYPKLGVSKAEVIVAICSMLHGPLSKKNSQAFASIKSIVELVSANEANITQAEAIAQLFLERFNPANPLPTAAFETRQAELLAKINRTPNDNVREVLKSMLETVAGTLRTNVYHADRYALAMKVHPSIMAVGKPELPYGVLFVHGRHFNGFHNRFRDIARGGLRLVTPPNSDLYALESSRQYDEVYGLSFAQQLKNKDIPEGGSKAVVLIDTPSIAPEKRFFAARKSVKAFCNSVLDLIVKDGVKSLVDLYGKDELIYLGPDEQIIPFDIDWICHRAAQRGYPIPAAFMSSKKGAGINHKEYGVTSEGIVVFLDVALKEVLKIDPRKQPFTIKVTGGPDGDVAGNLMKILFREYGNNCKIVGVADGFGVAEDPAGLNSDELLRLFDAALPITAFNPAKLNPEGVVMDASTEEGFVRRNTMCFRVKADAFVPAGGRPNTINIDNWKQFLDPVTGKPTSELIVEGANIFTTPEAREMLFKEANVKIVKDSSANKCGVVTSSCEVAASMLLTRDEFLNIKKELVEDVIKKLHHIARLEAELLFREFNNYPGNLPHFSERISNAIAKVTDAITDALENVSTEDALFQEMKPLIKINLPKKLADYAWDRVPNRFPVQYQKNAIASTLAAHLVYKEGIHFVESQPISRIAERAFMYYRQENKILALVEEIEKNGWDSLEASKKELVMDLLKRGGARTSLDIF